MIARATPTKNGQMYKNPIEILQNSYANAVQLQLVIV